MVEGVAPDDPLILPRKSLRAYVLHEASQSGFSALFTAPPGSGKSALINLLLADELKNVPVLRLSGNELITLRAEALQKKETPPSPTAYCLRKVMGMAPSYSPSSLAEAMAIGIPFWIIDEAQYFYSEPEFFTELGKVTRLPTVVVMFASHTAMVPTRAASPTSVRKVKSTAFCYLLNKTICHFFIPEPLLCVTS